MGWVSLQEDALERIQDSIHRAEESLENSETYTEEHRLASLRALEDAKAVLREVLEHLELATSPEVDSAHEIKELEKKVKSLERDVKVAESKANKYYYEAATRCAELQDAKREISALKKEKRKLEKQLDKMLCNDFSSAVDLFSSPGMIQKHKPDA